jgi:hypothetical protein
MLLPHNLTKMLKEKNKASVLIVTIIILGLILLSVLSMTLVSFRERKASMGDVRSQQAFQNSEAGVESVLRAIITNTDPAKKINELSGFECKPRGEIPGVDNAILRETGAGANLSYVAELKVFGYNEDPNNLSKWSKCDSTLVKDIVYVKATGSGFGQQRAIEAAVIMPVVP